MGPLAQRPVRPCAELGTVFAYTFENLAMKRFIILLLTGLNLLFWTSCSGVRVHYAKGTDFSRYHSYAYIARKVKPNLPLPDAKFITRSVDDFLRSEGLAPDEQNPDLLVEINLKFHKRVDVYHANSPWPRQAQSREGNVVITLKDARTHRAVWWTDMYVRYRNHKELVSIIRHKMAKLAERYPPK